MIHSPLLVGELGAGLSDGLHGGGHVVVPLRLLGQLGALDLLLLVRERERVSMDSCLLLISIS